MSLYKSNTTKFTKCKLYVFRFLFSLYCLLDWADTCIYSFKIYFFLQFDETGSENEDAGKSYIYGVIVFKDISRVMGLS